jgi:uncharacterized repeat protein (TIGR01451 family)
VVRLWRCLDFLRHHLNSSVFSSDAMNWIAAGPANSSYVPPNFLYNATAPSTVPVLLRTNPAGMSYTVDGTAYAGSQTFNWIEGVPHTVAAVTPQNVGAGIQYVWSDWSDGGGVSHTSSPSGATTLTADFVPQYVLSTVISPAGAGSIIATPAAASGYYSGGASVQLTAQATPGCAFAGWNGDLSGLSNPQSVSMTLPRAVTASFQCSNPPASTFLTGYALNHPAVRNDFSGWVGMKLIVASKDLFVSALGRICIAGNSRIHTVKFVNASSGFDVNGGSVSLDMSHCSGGEFAFATLSNTIRLPANSAYYVVSQENAGGDQWYDRGAVSSTAAAAINTSAYSYDGVSWLLTGTANSSYVPPNFLYTIAPALPPDLTITKTHTQNFAPGDTADTFTLIVANSGGAPTSGSVTVTDSIPLGLTATGLSGTGWNCTQPSGPCIRGDALNPGASYPPITLTVTVATNAPANVVNTATVSGGGETDTSNDTAMDPTAIGTLGSPFLALSTPASAMRNNFSGWVGMRLTVGQRSLMVSSLSRICIAGNTGAHVVKIVSAATGQDVPGASATVNMAGCAAGRYTYTALPNIITLPSETAFYLVTQELTGGDQWYDHGVVLPSADGTVNSSVYFDGANWVPVDLPNTSYALPNFQYLVGLTDTSLITAYNQNSAALRRNFSGWVGLKLTVGLSPIVVNSLGRLVIAGNSGSHTVKLVQAANGIDVPGASVSLSTAGGIAGQFAYSQLANPVTLAANTAYYLVSYETEGGDQWYDYGPVTSKPGIAVNSAVYSFDGANWFTVGVPNTSYVPPNLK